MYYWLNFSVLFKVAFVGIGPTMTMLDQTLVDVRLNASTTNTLDRSTNGTVAVKFVVTATEIQLVRSTVRLSRKFTTSFVTVTCCPVDWSVTSSVGATCDG